MVTRNRERWLREIRLFLLWYGAALLLLLLLLFGVVWNMTKDPLRASQIAFGTLTNSNTAGGVYFLSLLPYALFLLTRSLIHNFKHHRWAGLAKGAALKILLPASVLWAALSLIDLYRFNEVFDYTWDDTVENSLPHIQNLYDVDQKYRGIHLFNLGADSTDLAVLNAQNVEWVTFVPFINQDVYNQPPARIDEDSAWIERATERMERYKSWTQPYRFKVVLKPHIWLIQTPQNTWRSDIAMDNEADWEAWFGYYEEHMVVYASLAERYGFELFCIGTELHSTVSLQPDRWMAFIQRIRDVYSGKLIYAANWSDNLEDIPFWDQMDYIGIQAYFPIAQNESPDLEELEAGWQSHLPSLQALSKQYNKPILFTEIGYKSTTDAGITPWVWEKGSYRWYKQVSHKTQALCYQAFFNVVWPQPWFAGALLWQWRAGYDTGGKENFFTLRDKPALNIVAKGFATPLPLSTENQAPN